MIEGKKEPILSVLPRLRVSKKKKELRKITASPPLVRKHPAAESPESTPSLPPLPRLTKRSSEPSEEVTDREISKFENELLTREARQLLRTCEELFPGDPLVLGGLADHMPGRLVYPVTEKPRKSVLPKASPVRMRKPYVTASILETLLDYDDTQIPKVNIKGLEQAKSLCIERKTERLPPVINTPATVNLPSVRKDLVL